MPGAKISYFQVRNSKLFIKPMKARSTLLIKKSNFKIKANLSEKENHNTHPVISVSNLFTLNFRTIFPGNTFIYDERFCKGFYILGILRALVQTTVRTNVNTT